jgi:hypothetical protein
MVTVVLQLLVRATEEEIWNPSVVFGKLIVAGVCDSWHAFEVDCAGTVTDVLLTVIFWAVACSSTCTVLRTPGSGSTLPNDCLSMTMLTVVADSAGVKVLGEVHTAGAGAPGPALHAPPAFEAQVAATWPKRRVIDPVAVTVCPSWAFRVNQTGVVWEWLSAGKANENAVKVTANSLCIKCLFLPYLGDL